jgi:hypothetical protein
VGGSLWIKLQDKFSKIYVTHLELDKALDGHVTLDKLLDEIRHIHKRIDDVLNALYKK